MKKRRILFIGIIVILLFVIIYFHSSSDAYLRFDTIPNCNNQSTDYFIDDIKISFICIDNVYVKSNNESVSFQEYIEVNGIDDFIGSLSKKMKLVAVYRDGGTKLYKDNKITSKTGFSMLKCNKFDGNKYNNDIYIGPKNMGYYENFCIRDN